MVIACAGYRIVSKVGHHRVSLESTKLVLGKAAHKYADYFETCRRSEILSTTLFPTLRPERSKGVLVEVPVFRTSRELDCK